MSDANVEKQKVKEITDKLEQGIKELFESEKYKAYLNTMSKFHNYSFNNTLLIAMQKPEASLVAGYKAWKHDFHRHVNKGEKAIRILAPAPYKIKEERDKLDPITGEPVLDENGRPQTESVEVKIAAFRAVSVFDVSQTEGEPIPELETQELLSSVERYDDFLQALTAVAPVPITFEEIAGSAKGYYNQMDKRIAIQSGMSESQTLKTAVHETAHALLHDKDVNQAEATVKDRNTKEVEAESVAYTVCQHFGIETSDYSFGYIAGWSSGKDMKELKSSLNTIRKTASELITGIEGQLREIVQERAMEQEQEKESLLVIQNRDCSEYSLVTVRGMDAAEITAALSEMTPEDKGNPMAFLESRGAWTEEIANEQTKEFSEYHIDVRYNYDTDEIINFREAMEQETVTFGHNVQKAEQKPVELSDEEIANRQAQLLYGDRDSFGIYQLKDSPELVDYHFAGTDELLRRNLISDTYKEIQPDKYDLVYVGSLSELDGHSQQEMLSSAFMKFNLKHPEGFTGHSLSVSDVVVLHQDGKNTAHFVDSTGFAKLPEFMQTLEGNKAVTLTAEEKSFLEADVTPFVAKMFLAWDEVEDLGYRFLEEGYIDKYKASENALFGNGAVPDTTIYEMARRMQSGEDIREELARAFIGDFSGDLDISEAGAEAHFGDTTIRLTHGNAHKEISYEELGGGFLKLMESEYREIAQAREAEERQEAEVDTSGHDVQKAESEPQEEIGDEIIDLGDDREAVLAEMKQSLAPEQEAEPETELAFRIADRYISIHETEEGYDFSVFDAEYAEIDSGVYEDKEVSIREALTDIMEDLKSEPDNNGARGSITAETELIPMDYDGLMEKADAVAQAQIASGHDVQKPEPEVTLTVAECGEYHSMGAVYADLKTVDEAIAVWKQVSPDPKHMIPAIGIRVHVPGEDELDDAAVDILSNGRFELEFLEAETEVYENPVAMGMIAELIAKMPEVEMDVELSADMAAKVQEIRNAVQTEYKPLAKIEEQEEQNYNQIDNVLNNGAGERPSLRAKLAEKKALVAGKKAEKPLQKAQEKTPEKTSEKTETL